MKKVPNMYPNILICDMSGKPTIMCKKVVYQPAFSKDLFITPGRGWQRVAEGNVIKWHTLSIQMTYF